MEIYNEKNEILIDMTVEIQPFKRQPHKMAIQTQMCVCPFCGVGT